MDQCIEAPKDGGAKMEVQTDSAKPLDGRKIVTISDIIGEFGWYQLSLSLLAFVRYINVAMMTSIGPLIAPEVDFRCHVADPTLIYKPLNLTYEEFALNKCSLNLRQSNESFHCQTFDFNTTLHGITVTDYYGLVCDKNWMRSALQSIISVGSLLSCITSGPFADRYGRYYTAKLAFGLSLVSGLSSYFVDNFLLFAITRSISTFSDMALVNSLSTIILETLGNKYRGAVAIIIYTGWSVGVMVMPWVMELSRSYKHLMLITVFCHLITLPWLLTIRESVRSLLVNGHIEEALQELKYISKFNGCGSKRNLSEIDEKFDILKVKFVKLKQKPKSNLNRWNSILFWLGLSNIPLLFQNTNLTRTTLTLIWILFTGEFLYQFFILINSDVGDSIKLNYAIGGVMEILATLASIVMINKISRKLSIGTTMATVATLCILLGLCTQTSTISLVVLNVAKFSVSTLTSLTYVAVNEAFPTNIRQTGFGFCGFFSAIGSLIAPFVRTELVDSIGFVKVMLIITFFPAVSILITPLYLRETRGIELADDLDDVDSPSFNKNTIEGSTEESSFRKLFISVPPARDQLE